MAGSTTSLRGALLTLRHRLAKRRAENLGDVGDAIMDLFAEHGWVQVAGLHEVDPLGRVRPTPAARLGAAGRIDPRLRMIARAVETRALVTVREISEGSGPLAVVPLEDVDGRLRGVVVIHEMPFVAFTQEHLHLLVVLGGHTADLLSSADQAFGLDDPSARDFLRRARRAYEDLRRYDLPASLVGVVVGPTAARVGVDRVVEGSRRGLDQDWRRERPDGGVVLLLLMPLTDLHGVDGYERRITALLRERLGGAFPPEELVVRSRPLVAERPLEPQLEEMGRLCGLAA